MPEYVFRVAKAINEFNAPVGSQIVYQPFDPDSKIQVVHHMPAGAEADLLKHFGHLRLLHPIGSEQQALKLLYRALQLPESA